MKIEFRHIVMVGCLIIIGILGNDLYKKHKSDIIEFFDRTYTE